MARITRLPDNPRQELVIAAAGPAVNVAIAAILYFMIGPRMDLGDVLAIQDPRLGLMAKLLTVNVWLVLFNLIPAFPMDGGRILRSLLALRMPHTTATQIAAGVGHGIAFVFGFLGLFLNPLLIFIALFVYLGAAQEAAIAQMRDIAERVPVSAAMLTNFRVLGPESTLNDAVELLLDTWQHEFPVVDATGTLAGVLTRDDLIAAFRELGPNTPVSRVMRRDVPKVPSGTSFRKAFELMHESESPVVIVTDDDGRVAGIVTPEQVGSLMLVHSALRGRLPSDGWLGPGIEGRRRSA